MLLAKGLQVFCYRGAFFAGYPPLFSLPRIMTYLLYLCQGENTTPLVADGFLWLLFLFYTLPEVWNKKVD